MQPNASLRCDMSRETDGSDGHLVLRELCLPQTAAFDSLTSRQYLFIINGKFDIDLVQVPPAGRDIVRIEVITDEFFK